MATTTNKTKTVDTVKKVPETKTEVVKETPKEQVTEPITQKIEPKVPKKFGQEDLIICRSVTGGELLYPSKKSGQLYVWSNYNDTCEVEYQDLQSLKSTRSPYIFNPLFIIEDEDLVEQWSKDLKPVYAKFSGTEDMESFFNLDTTTFKQKLQDAPIGIKNAIGVFAGEKIQNGTLDSLSKINILDEILGTDLKVFIK